MAFPSTINVLIIEEDAIDSANICRLLENADQYFYIHCVSNNRKAHATLHDTDSDVILLKIIQHPFSIL